MKILFNICKGLSIGLTIGALLGIVKWFMAKTSYTPQQVENIKKLFLQFSKFLKVFTFLLLGLGFIWCCYFLVLAIIFPTQSDYASNMAELIVAVLSVISILFAFVEFTKRDKS
ncbi:transporter [Longibaculum muris]|uniref:transporter n=1 Tax=Longibaculum muris TaxID=1796628 RepID=UPI0022E69477|nr:transporter [Longibaculum muris]